MLPDDLDELSAILLVAVIQPAAAVHDVILLDDAYAAPVGRGVREHEDAPPLVGGLAPHEVLEPVDLPLVDEDLVARVLGVAKDRAAKSHEQGLLRDLPAELGRLLPVTAQERPEVASVGVELVYPLEVVIAAYHLVRDAEAAEEFRRGLVTRARAREELERVVGIVIAVLRFAEVSERNDGDAPPPSPPILLLPSAAVAHQLGLGVGHDVEDVLPPRLVVLHLAWVDVKVPQYRHDEGVRIVGPDLAHFAPGGGGSAVVGAVCCCAVGRGGGSVAVGADLPVHTIRFVARFFRGEERCAAAAAACGSRTLQRRAGGRDERPYRRADEQRRGQDAAPRDHGEYICCVTLSEEKQKAGRRRGGKKLDII